MSESRRFRKRPVVIEALHYDGTTVESFEAAYRFLGWDSEGHSFLPRHFPRVLLIDTLEGTLRCAPGDWIIRGVKGEFYPCKPDVFAATYEEVEGEDE